MARRSLDADIATVQGYADKIAADRNIASLVSSYPAIAALLAHEKEQRAIAASSPDRATALESVARILIAVWPWRRQLFSVYMSPDYRATRTPRHQMAMAQWLLSVTLADQRELSELITAGAPSTQLGPILAELGEEAKALDALHNKDAVQDASDVVRRNAQLLDTQLALSLAADGEDAIAQELLQDLLAMDSDDDEL